MLAEPFFERDDRTHAVPQRVFGQVRRSPARDEPVPMFEEIWRGPSSQQSRAAERIGQTDGSSTPVNPLAELHRFATVPMPAESMAPAVIHPRPAAVLKPSSSANNRRSQFDWDGSRAMNPTPILMPPQHAPRASAASDVADVSPPPRNPLFDAHSRSVASSAMPPTRWIAQDSAKPGTDAFLFTAPGVRPTRTPTAPSSQIDADALKNARLDALFGIVAVADSHPRPAGQPFQHESLFRRYDPIRDAPAADRDKATYDAAYAKRTQLQAKVPTSTRFQVPQTSGIDDMDSVTGRVQEWLVADDRLAPDSLRTGIVANAVQNTVAQLARTQTASFEAAGVESGVAPPRVAHRPNWFESIPEVDCRSNVGSVGGGAVADDAISQLWRDIDAAERARSPLAPASVPHRQPAAANPTDDSGLPPASCAATARPRGGPSEFSRSYRYKPQHLRGGEARPDDGDGHTTSSSSICSIDGHVIEATAAAVRRLKAGLPLHINEPLLGVAYPEIDGGVLDRRGAKATVRQHRSPSPGLSSPTSRHVVMAAAGNHPHPSSYAGYMGDASPGDATKKQPRLMDLFGRCWIPPMAPSAPGMTFKDAAGLESPVRLFAGKGVDTSGAASPYFRSTPGRRPQDDSLRFACFKIL